MIITTAVIIDRDLYRVGIGAGHRGRVFFVNNYRQTALIFVPCA